MDLLPGFNALTWTAATQAVASSDLAPKLLAAYAINPQSSLGYVSYVAQDDYNTLRAFVTGVNYLVKMSAALTTASGTLAPVDAFPAFPGYTPVVSGAGAALTTVSGTVTSTAAADIAGGRLVAQTAAGIVPYSPDQPDHRHRLLGIALNSSLAGGSVTVQRGGYVQYMGLGLPVNAVLVAQANGGIGTSTQGMAFQHVVGRSLSPDVFLFTPSTTYTL